MAQPGAGAGPRAALEEPRIFIYDNYPGGIGFSAPLFEVQDRLLEASADLIASCDCERGCPSCVGPIGEIGPQGKRVALDLLERLTGRVAVSSVGDAGHRRRRGAVLVSGQLMRRSIACVRSVKGTGPSSTGAGAGDRRASAS